jgi:hypothetical protein
MKVPKRRIALIIAVVALLIITHGIALAWTGSVHANLVDVSNVSDKPWLVHKALNDPGCNDYFAVYKLNYLPTRAGSYTNLGNYFHMLANGGLNGFWNRAPYGAYYTYDVSMCVKHGRDPVTGINYDGYKYWVGP